MAVYRQIQTSYWQDDFVLSLTPEQKYFYIYLMTNSKTTQSGLYKFSKRVACFETGYNIETIDKLLKYFIETGRVCFDDDTEEVLITNWLKYNPMQNIKILKCVEKEIKNTKSKYLLERFNTVCIRYGYGIDTPYIPIGEEKEEEQEKEEEEEQEKESKKIPYQEIVDLYNSICTSLTKVRIVSKDRKEHISARYKQFGQDVSVFKELFEKAQASDFITNRNGTNRNKFKGDFDWLLTDTYMPRVLEGKYDNGEGNDEAW